MTAAEAGELIHVSRSRWHAYSRRYRALVRGRRIVRANPNGKGVARWLRSALIEHMHDELERDRAPTPEVAESTAPEPDEQEES